MKKSISSISIPRLVLLVLLSQPLVAREANDASNLPLECRIRAVHKGGGADLELKISLENTGEPPLRVMMPNWWFNMSAGCMIGGWEFKFIAPNGEPAKLDWGVPPPGPKPLIPRVEQTTMLRKGAFVGITLPIKGQLKDLERVSKVVVTYWVMENFKEEYLLKDNEWPKKMSPSLWEGKVVSNEFDISLFMQRRANKAVDSTR